MSIDTDAPLLQTPLISKRFRDPAHIKGVYLKMGTPFLDALDELAKINSRSRREVVEILIAQAYEELQYDDTVRLIPS